jgi:hypothetical protein
MSGGPSPGRQRHVEVFKSAGIGEEKTQSDHRYRLVSLSRNFGHKIAISAGMDFVRER